jgi:hypothetical protein
LAEDVNEWRNSDEEFDEDWYQRDRAREAEDTQGSLCVCGCGGPYIKPGTAQYYRAHMDEPVVRGMDADGNPVNSSVSVREFFMAILQLHLRYNISKSCMDVMLCLFASIVPGRHFIPRSIHLLRKVTDTPEHSVFIKQACAAKNCPGHLYPDLPDRSTWLDHVDDKCPKCSHPRFQVTEFGGRYVCRSYGMSVEVT